MSYYRTGDIVRLTRIANGISQEELSYGICSVQTLHRIENGKTRVKKELYYRLMERMERVPEKTYAVCVGKDLELLEERMKFEDCMNEMEYEKADEYVRIIKEKADDNLITQQYVQKAEALVEYHCKRIDGETLMERLEEVIGLTVPDYRDYLDKKYPFTEQELFCILNIAQKYTKLDKYDEAIQFYEKILECLNMEYIFGGNITHLKIITLSGLARAYGSKKEYDKANELSKEALNMVKAEDEGIIAEGILTDITWNVLRQIERNERKKEDVMIAKKKLRQAYYLALARDDKKITEICEKVYEKEFKENIKDNYSKQSSI